MRSKILIGILCVFFSGCALFKGRQVSKNRDDVSKQVEKVGKAGSGLEKNGEASAKAAAVLATGTKISLAGITNASLEIQTANLLNNRVLTLLPSVSLEEFKKIDFTVKSLNSLAQEERAKGLAILNQRDQEIISLQKEKGRLEDKYEEQIKELTNKANQIAKTADHNAAIIDDINSDFGLKAIFLGFKRLFFSIMWFLVCGLVIYILLRVFASSSPIIGGIFNIFESFGAMAIKIIQGIAPKAASFAKLIPREDGAKYKRLILKVVDSICEFRHNSKINSSKTYTLDEVLARFARDFDQSEKDLVTEMEKETGWKK